MSRQATLVWCGAARVNRLNVAEKMYGPFSEQHFVLNVGSGDECSLRTSCQKLGPV